MKLKSKSQTILTLKRGGKCLKFFRMFVNFFGLKKNWIELINYFDWKISLPFAQYFSKLNLAFYFNDRFQLFFQLQICDCHFKLFSFNYWTNDNKQKGTIITKFGMFFLLCLWKNFECESETLTATKNWITEFLRFEKGFFWISKWMGLNDQYWF